jgi:ABC-type multidrug transport system ATPase subunit
MSTHTLEVAQEMCDRISIILKGRSSRAARSRNSRDGRRPRRSPTSVFLKLTGGSGLQEIDEIV